MYDINKIRDDFPILSREVYGKPLVYLDNAATTQKPLCVLDAMRDEYLNVNANVHRGVHDLNACDLCGVPDPVAMIIENDVVEVKLRHMTV